MLVYIELDTPFNPGAYDPDGYTYPHCLVSYSRVKIRDSIISLQTEYGTMTSSPIYDGYGELDGYFGTWERGVGSPDTPFVVPATDYYDLIMYPPANFEEALHQWLIDNGKVSGIIVNIET